jgi:nucleotide-binding universal stress UspA family protein
MSYKSILVQLDASERAPVRLQFALELAKRFEAHLTGLFVVFRPEVQSFYVMAGNAEYFIDQEAFRTKREHDLAQRFIEGIAHAQVVGEGHTSSAHPNKAVPEAARMADLTIVGQFNPEDPESFIADQFVENLVLSAGRPVLVVPYAGDFPTVGTRVLVAWDGSREATRALHDALPLLTSAERVIVLTVNALEHEPMASRIPGADIAAILARHGVNVVTEEVEGVPAASVGNLLLSNASDFGADLIVMGCYGHSRWRELVLGGATRTILKSMTVPVLMSH